MSLSNRDNSLPDDANYVSKATPPAEHHHNIDFDTELFYDKNLRMFKLMEKLFRNFNSFKYFLDIINEIKTIKSFIYTYQIFLDIFYNSKSL